MMGYQAGPAPPGHRPVPPGKPWLVGVRIIDEATGKSLQEPQVVHEPAPLTIREQHEVAELLDLGFNVGEIADIWRDAGLPLASLQREIQRITGDSRPLPTPMPAKDGA